jgi:hypothetical protein
MLIVRPHVRFAIKIRSEEGAIESTPNEKKRSIRSGSSGPSGLIIKASYSWIHAPITLLSTFRSSSAGSELPCDWVSYLHSNGVMLIGMKKLSA